MRNIHNGLVQNKGVEMNKDENEGLRAAAKFILWHCERADGCTKKVEPTVLNVTLRKEHINVSQVH